MDTKHLRQLKEAIEAIAVQYEIEFAVLFGSQATGAMHGNSDVDVAISSMRRLAPRDTASFAYDISGATGSLPEIVDVKSASPLLLRDIARDGMILYEKTPHAFERFRVYGYKRFMESKSLRALRRVSLDRFLAKTI